MSAASPPEVDPAAAADPVAAVLDAHDRGAPLLLRTTGTTGSTRPVRRTTASWWSSFDGYSTLTGVDERSRLWAPGPLTSTMTLFARVHARAVGAIVVDAPRDATHACLTPAVLDRRGGELPRGARVTVGGAGLPRRLHRLAGGLGLRVSCYYGAAELSFVAAGPHAEELRGFPGVELEIRDAVIHVRSPYLALGVADQDGWASVGDRGHLDEDGLLRVHGRPDTATTAGATVPLADVEATLQPHAVGTVTVLGVPHAGLGELVVAVLEEPADAERLPPVARAELPPSHRPRRWQVVAELPLTGAGKVDRAALRRLVPQ